MVAILTPKEVHDVESYTLSMLTSGQWPTEGEYICEAVYARLEQSHERLRTAYTEERDTVSRVLTALGIPAGSI